jgi:hypothetical protein
MRTTWLQVFFSVGATCALASCGDSTASAGGGQADAEPGFGGFGGTGGFGGSTGGAGGQTGGAGGQTGGAGGQTGGSSGGSTGGATGGAGGGTGGDPGPTGGKGGDVPTGGSTGGSTGGDPVPTGGTGGGGAGGDPGPIGGEGPGGQLAGGATGDGGFGGGGAGGDPGPVGGFGGGGPVGGDPGPIGGDPGPVGGTPVESDAGVPVGPPPDVQGLVYLREAQNQRNVPFADPLLLDMLVYFREYRTLPSDAAPQQTNGACALYAANDFGTAGDFDLVDAGAITIGGTVDQDIVFSFTPRGYTPAPAAIDLFELWDENTLLTFDGEGSMRIGPFARDIATPLDVVGVQPDLMGNYDRAGTTLTWTPGNGDLVRITLRAPGWASRIVCEADDAGSFDVPAAVFAWIPGEFGQLNVDFTRARIREFDTDEPRARGVLHLERAFSFEGMALQ